MDERGRRRERLHRLIDLALAAKRASKTGLAGYLARDRRHLYPDTDNPKLDLLVALGDALEWPLEAIVDFIWRGPEGCEPLPEGLDYATLDEQAVAAHHRGDFPGMVSIARQMQRVAKTPAQRGRAYRLEAAGWGGQGRLTHALSAIRRGLDVEGLPTTERIALECNLANAYYSLWELSSARGVAHAVVDHFATNSPNTQTDRASVAFALYVRGNAVRRMLNGRPADGAALVKAARDDLAAAERLYEELARQYGGQDLAAIANTCRGALLELEVEAGRRDALEAIEHILAAIPNPDAPAPWPPGEWLESYGWWCDFGANIAQRHLSDAGQQRYLAIFSEKLLRIGRRLGNWELIERAVSIDYSWRSRVADKMGVELPAVLDFEDVRTLVGTIGRFPHLWEPGWRLLSHAAVATR